MSKRLHRAFRAAALTLVLNWLMPTAARGEPADEKLTSTAGQEIGVGPPSSANHGADQRTLQDAIDRCGAAGGGTVRIAAGRYLLQSALTLRDKVQVVGIPGRTILAACDGARSLLSEDAPHGDWRIAIADAGALRVGDGVAIHDDRSPGAFAVTTATLVESLGPHTFRLSEPLVQDYAVARHATVVRAFPVVGGWHIHGAAVEGITVDGNRAKAGYLDGCRGAGIYLYACQDVTIRNCTVQNCRADGISFQWSSRDITVEGCLIEKCAGFGLHPGSDSHDSIVRRNRALGNGGPGLFVCENVKHVVFEENELRDNLGPGISIGCKDTDNRFRENTIRGNGRTGILFRDDGGEIKGAHRNTFEKNVVLDNGPREKTDRQSACITIEGTHRDLILRNNTLGNTQPGRETMVGIAIDNAPGLVNEGNQFLNLKTPTAAHKTQAKAATK